MRSNSFFQFLLALTAGVGATLVVSENAQADTLNVYVGYADNLRPSGFFPSPWINAAGVVSQTCAGVNPCKIVFDSGAVRIQNTSAVPLDISNFQVSDNNGAVVFNIWGPGTQLVIPVGGNGIFTQFNSNTENFDSSDQGLFGALPPSNLAPNQGGNNQIGGCSSIPALLTPTDLAGACNPLNAPVITFDENGNPVKVVDTGFIINTGEWDFVNNGTFNEDGNESIDWNLAGSSANRGGSTPEPSYVALLGVGLSAMIGFARKRRANAK